MHHLPDIVIITPGFPENDQDTSCVPLVWQTVLALAKRLGSDNVSVFTLQYPFNASKYQFKGIRVNAIGGRNRSGLYRLITVLKTIWSVRRMVRVNKNTIFLSFWYTETSLAGKSCAYLFGGKHYIWLQGQDALMGNPYVKRVRVGAHRLIALSERQAGEFRKNYRIRPAHIIGSGIEPMRFPPLNTDIRPIDLIAVGSLIPLKNHSAFIHMVGSLKLNFPSIRAALVGEGPKHDELVELITSLGLTNQIHLTGSVPHHSALEYMAHSKILVHLSSYEGYGTVIPEALYSGCTVVTKLSPVSREIKNLFVCDSDEAAVEKTAVLLKTPLKAERVMIHSIEEIADKLLAVISSSERPG